jgi:hypothetical protein
MLLYFKKEERRWIIIVYWKDKLNFYLISQTSDGSKVKNNESIKIPEENNA